ncbi:hypothetical protein ABPG75_013763 [Micractinium tetrahymenae]
MWKFQQFLNQDLAIMLVIAIGALSVVRFVIFKKEDIRLFNVFLFKLTLPASVILGLGIKTNLYNADIWRFVGAFLMMRAIMLAACALVFGLLLRRSLGEVTANWLSTTWISTVILGVPLLQALLGPSYANLGVVAGISSFIFQLPLMLILFEVHTWREENLRGGLPEVQGNSTPRAPLLDGSEEEAGSNPDAKGLDGTHPPQGQQVHPDRAQAAPKPAPVGGNGAVPMSAADASTMPAKWRVGGSSLGRFGGQLLGCLDFRMTRKQARRLGLRLLTNHVLWGVAIGIILSLSTLGYKYLDPGSPPACPNCRYAVGAGFIYILLDYFARCTEPVAFFATGMWMVRPNPIATGWVKAVLYMIVKLILVPMLMVGCCFAVGLNGATARAAVLVATLPVSAAAFALCKTYNVGDDVAVVNVFLGNLLILPTTIAWVSAMDGMDLFPASYSKLPPTCAKCT